MAFDLVFPCAIPGERAKGVIKSCPEDFFVEEQCSVALDGNGEHDWLWIEKCGQNTDFVARGIARYAGVRDMDVGFSGLKDRHAITRQWFSVYRRGRASPDWQGLQLEGVSLLKASQHRSKLRRGEHDGNRFRIVVRDLVEAVHIEEKLRVIVERGFPNYFGEQRFGRDAANLERGARYFAGELKASRSQRGYYLSAARSYLFNLNLARAITEGSWCLPNAQGPLYGDAQRDVTDLSEQERSVLEAYPLFAKGIHGNRMKLERRPYCVLPKALSWHVQDDMLTLTFDLPKGVFATSLLKELVDYRTGSAYSVGAQEN